jgi:hypothetical protein
VSYTAAVMTEIIVQTDVALQSHEEAAGLVGMPKEDRTHFEPNGIIFHVAQDPNEVMGRPAIVVLEQ